MFDIVQRGTGGIEAIFHGLEGKGAALFHAIEAFLRYGGDHLAVLQQRGGGIHALHDPRLLRHLLREMLFKEARDICQAGNSQSEHGVYPPHESTQTVGPL